MLKRPHPLGHRTTFVSAIAFLNLRLRNFTRRQDRRLPRPRRASAGRRELALSVLFLTLITGPVTAGVFDALEKLGTTSLAPDREFLDPEVAFRFSQTPADHGVDLSWEIEPGYYLYRDKVAVKTRSESVRFGDLEKPPGEMKDDPDFGAVAVYKHDALVHVPVQWLDTNAEESSVEVTYQGCAEDGICYPPIKKTFDLRNAQMTGKAAAAPLVPGGLSVADGIAAELAAGSLTATIGTFFVFGLLLSFTPCVFPMVPILSGIIVGQTQPVTTRRSIALSAVYVVAVALTYAVVGLAAGIFGQNLQAMFQHPAAIVSFSLIFVALSLSMFGFYELQLPTAWQTRLDQISRSRNGGNLLGVGVMGVLSAIIVGPCVAPPLAGALLYLGHQGSAIVGASALFALGLGMGAPLLLIGASAGRLLPRAGAWMESIKRVFGVMLLGVAIWFLERVLPGQVTLALWASLAIVSAVYMGALDNVTTSTNGWRRLTKGLGLSLLIYGVVLVVGAAAGGGNALVPLETLAGIGTGARSDELPFKAVKGVVGFEEAMAEASAQGRGVMLDFYADWCVECKHLERETFRDPAVQAQLSDLVLLRADVTSHDAADRELLQRFELFGPPAILFFDSDGNERRAHRVLGFLGPAAFSAQLTSR